MRLTPATLLLLGTLGSFALARTPEPPPAPDSGGPAPVEPIPGPRLGDAGGEWLATMLAPNAPPHDSLGDVRGELRRLYGARHWQFLWASAGWPSPGSRRVIASLDAAAEHGLDPQEFDAAALRDVAMRMGPPASAPSAVDLARFDLALSVSAVRFMGALYSGRVSPRFAHPTLHWRGQVLDRVRMLDSLASTPRPDTLLVHLAPHTREYQRLRRALVLYREAGEDSIIERLKARRRALHAGNRYADAAGFRRLLTLAGINPNPKLTTATRESLVTWDMIDRVRRLEQRDSTTIDNAIGAHAAGTLQEDLRARARVVALAMERQRWFTRDFPLAPIVVNIPSFDLRYWRATTDDSGLVMEMKVQVGRADSTETPMLSDRLRAVIFRPYWDIPPSIMRKEVLPKALVDSLYIEHQGYELVRGPGSKAPVVPVTAENIAEITRTVRVRQPPGPANALGNMKFQLSNDESIYMHDTPQRSLFGRTRRDFSHGCIRLQNAPGLAEYLLRDHADWPLPRIHAAARADTQAVVALTEPVPVEIVYWTARTRDDGSIEFVKDIYGHDPTLDSLMQLRYPLPR